MEILLVRHIRLLVFAAICVVLQTAADCPAQPSGNFVASLLVDDFEDSNRFNLAGGEWRVFSWGWDNGNQNNPNIAMSIIRLPETGNALQVLGRIPDNGSGHTFAGFFTELAPPGQFLDLTNYDFLSFIVMSRAPGYYRVRLENADLNFESSKILFAATNKPQRVSIPLKRFSTGITQIKTLVFDKNEDKPGDPFHLVLDHIGLYRKAAEAAFSQGQKELPGGPWAANPGAAWQLALNEKKPLLLYFMNPTSEQCTKFEEIVLGNAKFVEIASQFALCQVNAAASPDLAERFDIFRVPAFLVIDPVTRSTVVVNASHEDVNFLTHLQELSATDWSGKGVEGRTIEDAYTLNTVQIDDFSDGSTYNRLGGRWGDFNSVEGLDINKRLVLKDEGNFVLEILGDAPAADNWNSGAGISCELSWQHSKPRDLTAFEHIEFKFTSEKEREYKVTFENSVLQGDAAPGVVFKAGPEPVNVKIPLPRFGATLKDVTNIVFTPVPGREQTRFRFFIDDVQITRAD